MVNKVIVNYLKKHKSKYPLSQLRRKIISSGYNPKDVDEAINVLGLRTLKKPIIKNVSKPLVKSKIVSKPIVKKQGQSKVSFVGDSSKDYSKWFKIAAISGILFLILPIIFSFFSGASSIISFILFLIVVIVSFFFYWGFVLLGKKYDSRLLKIISWIFIILLVLFLILQIIGLFSPGFLENFLPKQNVSSGDIQDLAGALVGILLGVLIFAIILLIILGILFGIGLMKLKEKVAYAKAAGILNIIGSATLIIGVGVLVLFVAKIFEIILLFKESKK